MYSQTKKQRVIDLFSKFLDIMESSDRSYEGDQKVFDKLVAACSDLANTEALGTFLAASKAIGIAAVAVLIAP
jgi:hypothetical protein